MTKLRIVSDGTSIGTQVIDENFQPIEGVTKISWSIKVGELAKVTLELECIQTDVAGEQVD